MPTQLLELDVANIAEYLSAHGHLAPQEAVVATELSGGVSSTVIYVSRTKRESFVVKQARRKLKVEEPWFCSLERIWRETEVLRICSRVLGTAPTRAQLDVVVPQVLFEDREQYLYAMTAAPRGHVVWKRDLLAGVARGEIGASAGALLGRLHAGTWHDPMIARELDDRTYFDDLRLDPYYRQIARAHVDLSPAIEELLDSVLTNRHCLVHGDYSPKNLLVCGSRLMLIDFEVGHYGDPAFDLGFFLTHLLLKACHHAPEHRPYVQLMDEFWTSYRANLGTAISAEGFDELVARAIQNLAGCALARLDGKSRVDYLTNKFHRDMIRQFCRTIFADRPQHWPEVRSIALARLAAMDATPHHLTTGRA